MSDEVRQERLRILALLCLRLWQGASSEEQIAEELKYVDSAGKPLPEVMYDELRDWGLPPWLLYRKEKRLEKGKKKRKARGTGDVEGLPPAVRSEVLFRKDLERLAYYLEELPGLREQLQAKRFVSSFWVGEDFEYLDREEFSDEQWRELCERHGVDPTTKELRLPIDPIKPGGSTPEPWEGLVALIAVHALLHGSVEDLIDALHPYPFSADRDELHKRRGHVDWLKTYAGRLAKAVRGGDVRTGTNPSGISDVDHFVAWYLIAPYAERGLPDKQIHARIRKEHPSLCEPYTVKDVTRLRELRLPPPDRRLPEDLL